VGFNRSSPFLTSNVSGAHVSICASTRSVNATATLNVLLAAVTIPTATSEHLYLRVGDDYFESPGGHIRIFSPQELAQGLARAGLATTGVGFAHALHTPYWLLRSVAGLPRADESALVRAYRRFLINATVSPAMARLERVLDYVCPKSVILYAEKRGAASARAA